MKLTCLHAQTVRRPRNTCSVYTGAISLLAEISLSNSSMTEAHSEVLNLCPVSFTMAANKLLILNNQALHLEAASDEAVCADI